jgi:hypothetical protein
VLRFGERYNAQAPLAHERRIGKEFIGFYFRQSHGLGDRLAYLDFHLRILGVAGIYRHYGCSADCALLVSRCGR